MKTTILASKTGQMNMGGYFKEKTAQVYTHSFEGFEATNNFRFSYIGDRVDECFDKLEDAMVKFNEACKNIKN